MRNAVVADDDVRNAVVADDGGGDERADADAEDGGAEVDNGDVKPHQRQRAESSKGERQAEKKVCLK